MQIVSQTRSKQRQVCLFPQDLDAFTEALRERWPSLTIWPEHYSSYQKEGPSYRENWKDIPEYPSMGCPEAVADGMLEVFVKPPGWHPRWSRRPNRHGIHTIENFPNLVFHYRQIGGLENYNCYTRIDMGRPIDMRGGDIWAIFDKDDREAARFVNAVWRILTTVSTNVIDGLSRTEGTVTEPAVHSLFWCGYHALEWCRQDPDRTLASTIRPVGTTHRPVKPLIAPPRRIVVDGVRMTADEYFEMEDKKKEERKRLREERRKAREEAAAKKADKATGAKKAKGKAGRKAAAKSKGEKPGRRRQPRPST